MDPEVAGLIRVFHSLTTSQQHQAVGKLNEYINADYAGKRRIVNESEFEQVSKRMKLGPVSNVCPYCGR